MEGEDEGVGGVGGGRRREVTGGRGTSGSLRRCCSDGGTDDRGGGRFSVHDEGCGLAEGASIKRVSEGLPDGISMGDNGSCKMEIKVIGHFIMYIGARSMPVPHWLRQVLTSDHLHIT